MSRRSVTNPRILGAPFALLLLALGALLLLRQRQDPATGSAGIEGPPVAPEAPADLRRDLQGHTPLGIEDLAEGDLRIPAAPPPTPGWSLTLRALDPRGEAVPGARFSHRSEGGGERTALGPADPRGSLEVDAGALAPGELVAEAEGFEPASRPLPAPGTETIVLEVAPLPRIFGTLRWRGGALVGAGYRVIAWPADSPLEGEERLRRVLAGQEEAGSLVWAETDARGAFELSPVRRGVRYRVIAGGPAGLSNTRQAFEISPDPIEIPLDALYGLRVHVGSADGEPLRRVGGRPTPWSYSNLPPGYSHGFRLRPGFTQRVFLDPRWLEMPEFDSVRPEDQHLVMIHGPYGPQTLDSIRVSASALGHGRARGESPARRMDLAPIDVHLALERTEDCWGAGEVHLDGALTMLAGEPGTGRDGAEVATLWVVQVADKTKGLTLSLTHPLVSPVSLPDLPCGTYSVYLASSVGNLAIPPDLDHPILLEVQPGRTGHVTLHTEGIGAIEVEVRYDDGESYEGPLILFVMQGRTGDMLPFDRPPYVSEGYAPGAYDLVLHEVGGRIDWDEPPKVRVEVLADQVARATLVVPR